MNNVVEKSVFDVDEVDDLPFTLKAKKPNIDVRLLHLYSLANGRELTYDELRVAYYRLYEEVKTPKQLSPRVSELCRAGKIEIVRKGEYRLARFKG